MNSNSKCLASFIIGLIGSILGMLGGLCTTMCSCGFGSDSAFYMIFGGGVLGMIGTTLCLRKAKLGSLLQITAAVLIIIRAYNGGAELMSVFAWIFLLVAGVIGAIYTFIINPRGE